MLQWKNKNKMQELLAATPNGTLHKQGTGVFMVQ